MTRVKMCGLMNKEDIDLCVKAGVHALGLVVEYPEPVPWNLSRAEAARLMARVPPLVSSVVVTGGPAQKILETARELHPDIVQLHYQESLGEVEELAEELSRWGIKTIKALRIDGDGKCAFDIHDPAAAVRALARTKISGLLVDSYTPSLPGGTGIMVDLEAFIRIRGETDLPIILAGGLNPANVSKVIQETNPYAVDVLTGVEERPGQKSAYKVLQFMQRVNALNSGIRTHREGE